MKRNNRWAWTGILLTMTTACLGQQLAKGTVYEDMNRNGKKDSQERGIPDVAVTNGREVVLTNAKGEYQLPVGDDNILSVIKPSGYAVPLDKYNKPQSYYIHKPKGTPASICTTGIAPTGKLPSRIDFALYRSEEPEAFRALIFGDPQPHYAEHLEYYKKSIVKEVEGVKNVAFGISMGDITDEDFGLYRSYAEIMKSVGVPWYNVIGNHDYDYKSPQDRLSNESFKAFFGPVDYAFNYGKVHVLVLDNLIYPDPRQKTFMWSGFREDQLDFVANDLKFVPKDKLIVVAVHVPLFDKEDWFNQGSKECLFTLLKDFPHVMVISAHMHIQEQIWHTAKDGWRGKKPLYEYNIAATCGNWYSGFPDKDGVPESMMTDGTPKGYAYLNVNGNEYTIDYKVAGQPADYQIRVMNPVHVVQNRYTPAYITANFFMGGENDVLECRIDGGAWKKMQKALVPDPVYTYNYLRWNLSEAPKLTRWPSEGINSSHIWRMRIPSNLPLGEHQIEVRVTDRFGRTHTGKGSYTIVKPIKLYP